MALNHIKEKINKIENAKTIPLEKTEKTDIQTLNNIKFRTNKEIIIILNTQILSNSNNLENHEQVNELLTAMNYLKELILEQEKLLSII